MIEVAGEDRLDPVQRGLERHRLAIDAGHLLSDGEGVRQERLEAAPPVDELVVGIDGRTIGNGRPGPITARLQELYRAAVEADVTGD